MITLTKSEKIGTTKDCAQCGERLLEPVRGDIEHYRQPWREGCKTWADRDITAVLFISPRGWVRFGQSKREAGEAMVQEGEGKDPQILKVDTSKLLGGDIHVQPRK